MNFTFVMYDPNDGRLVEVSQDGVESLDEVLQRFLDFLKGVSYTYVDKVAAIYDDGTEKWTS